MKEKLIKYYQNNKKEFKKYYCIDKNDFEYIDNNYIKYFFETCQI